MMFSVILERVVSVCAITLTARPSCQKLTEPIDAITMHFFRFSFTYPKHDLLPFCCWSCVIPLDNLNLSYPLHRQKAGRFAIGGSLLGRAMGHKKLQK